MKLRKWLSAVLFAMATIACALGIVGCGKSASDIGPYYVEYGQVFVVPSFDGQTTVTDSEGYIVDISSGRFYVNSTANYTIEVKKDGATSKGDIIVITRDIPIISSSFDVHYGLVNETTALPSVNAFVNGDSVDTTGVMKKGDTVIDVSNGFVPVECGEYTYTISATANGKSTSKEVVYYIESTKDYENKIASFDKPYGVKQIKKFYGISSSYSTDIKYGDEVGSTKITISTAESEHEAQYAYGNFHIKDWSNIVGIGLYVYNDNLAPITFNFNWSNSTVLMPGEWTQVYVPHDKFGEFKSFGICSMFDIHSADGLCTEIVAPISGKGTFSIYLSAMYAREKDYVSPENISQKIETFIAAEKPDYTVKAEIEKDYAELPDNMKAQVENYTQFRNKCLELIRAEEHDENVLIQTDRPYGMNQLKGSNALLSYSSGIRYQGESGSMKIQAYGFFAQLDIEYPMVDDIGDIEYLEFYIYNGNPKNYAIQLNYPSLHTESLPSGQWTCVRLDMSKVSSVAEIDLFVQIYSGNWSQGMEKDNAIFYMSSVKMVRGEITTGQELYDLIEKYKTEGNYIDDDVKLVVRYYEMLSATEQAVVTNYKQFVKSYYLSRDEVPTDNADRLTYFDSEYGLLQSEPYSWGCDMSYSTDKAYGDEKGSLKLTGNGATWFMYFRLTEIEDVDLSKYDFIEFYMYADFDQPAKLIGDHGMLNGLSAINLEVRSWTKVQLPIPADGNIVNVNFLALGQQDDGHGVDSNAFNFYVSAMYAVKSETTANEVITMIDNALEDGNITIEEFDAVQEKYNELSVFEQEKVTTYRAFVKQYYIVRDEVSTDNADRLTYFDSEYGIQQVATYSFGAEFSYSTDKAYGDEKGSLKLTGNDNTYNLYFKLTEIEIADLSEYSYIEFYVYVNFDEDAKLCENHGLVTAADGTIILAANQWTKVRLAIPKDGNLVNTSEFIAFRRVNGDVNSSAYSLYISAMYAVKSETTASDVITIIDNALEDGNITIEEFDAVQEKYNKLSVSEQEKVTTYRAFVKQYYIVRDEVPTDNADRLTYFDSEYGLLQAEPYSMGCDMSYSTDKAYGDEKGSLKLTGNGATWFMYFRLTEIEDVDLSKYDFIEFYIYADFDQPAKLIEDHGMLNGLPAINLEVRAWTKVQLPIPADGNIVNVNFLAMGQQADGHGVDSNAFNFYVSAMYAVKG